MVSMLLEAENGETIDLPMPVQAVRIESFQDESGVGLTFRVRDPQSRSTIDLRIPMTNAVAMQALGLLQRYATAAGLETPSVTPVQKPPIQ